jgi:hypothetical protein
LTIIPPTFAESAKISQMQVATKGKFITINAKLIDGFDEKILEAIQNGMSMTFTFDIELLRDDLIKDNLIRANKVSHTIQYDSLKKVYRFTQKGKNVNRKIITRKKIQIQELMSTLQDIPIAPVYRLNPEEKYYIRVKAKLDSRDSSSTLVKSLFFFVPFNDFTTSWAQTPSIEFESDMIKPDEVTAETRDGGNEEDLNHVIRSFNK